MSKSGLKKKYLVTKHNALNKMRTGNMTLQELRLFSIYLSKINPEDMNTRVVRFPLVDFQEIMDLARLHIDHLQSVADSLLKKTITLTEEYGGFTMFQLFKTFKMYRDKGGQWFAEIDAHDEALPLMFDFKSHYFKYALWNTLRLKSKNQFRMYEILKQHEKLGARIIAVKDLKEQLGINENDYPQYKEFKRRVLDVGQKALAEYTDISYEYEPYGKKGRGGKILELKFTITKNKDYVDPLGLDKFIDFSDRAALECSEQNEQEIDFDDIDENGNVRATGRSWMYEERITFLMDACNNEFSREQIVLLFDNLPDSVKHDENDSHDYLQSKYREMNMRKPSVSRFGYLKKMINDAEA